jgi:gliding motility-associated-like protein
MTRNTTTPFRLSLVFMLLFSLGSFAQVESGGACLNCPAQTPGNDPSAKTMDGNQSNVTSYTASACGLNYVFGSVKIGKRGSIGGVTQPAPIIISGIPAGCANVIKAFLYTDASGNGTAITATVTNPSSISNSYPMSIIGTASDKCWSYSGSYSYRADITSAITGNGTYSISGLPTNPPTTGNDCDGATILIIYSDPSQTYTGNMIIADGAHVAKPGTVSNNISMPAACANSTFANGLIIVADLQAIAATPMTFNNSTPNYTLATASQTYWNAVQNTAPMVTSGQTSAAFGVGPTTGDCFNVVVSALYYRTTCNTCSFSPGTMSLTTVSSSSCSTGSATATASGGTGPYTYSWTPGSATTQTISGLPGIYTVTSKDAACNQVTSTVAISALAPVTLNLNTVPPSCLVPAGSSTATVGGGSTATGFTVTWSPAPGTVTPTSNGSIASGLSTGTYSVVVVDATGCSTSSSFNVSSPAPLTFSVSGSTVLTCSNPSIVLTANNTSTLANVSYTWMPGSVNSQTLLVTTPGVYTVTGQDASAGSCVVTETFAVTQNTTAPSMTVSPISQTLTCNGGCKTFTAVTTTTTNIIGQWFDPSSSAMGPVSGTPLIMCANAPGTYTATFCSQITGCCTSQTVAVSANTIVPTITITPVTNNGFTINCTHPNVQMNINSSSTLAPTSYSWTNLSSSVTTSPAAGGFTASVPGQYVAGFKDGSGCVVSTTITIYIDTLRPTPYSMTNLPSNSYTLNCYPNSSLVATALSNPMLPASNYSWTVPPNLTMFTNTVLVSLSNITSSTAPTSYTVIAMGANGCIGKQKVNFYKDVYLPPYSIVFTPTAITCSNPCVALTGVSSASTPVSYTFVSPPPTQSATTAGVLMCSNGTYSMTYTNLLNGCTGSTTNIVPLNTTPPGTVAMTDVFLPCGQTTTSLTAGTTTTSTTYSYNWGGPPLAGFTCASCYSTGVNAQGVYTVLITNTVNGCESTNSVAVVPGSITASFTPTPASGFAPLTVNFQNMSQLGSSTGGTVFATWMFGNGYTAYLSGASAAYSSPGGPSPTPWTYQSAGSYTVWLIMNQSNGLPLAPGMPFDPCISTYSFVINVELPSELVVPNVFTPNADGVNDVFHLQSTNLTEISFVVFDRWGVKMFDCTTDKGNIEWDGKNLSNKDVPAGTYFYLLKAKGKDIQEYEKQGTINLFR